MESVKKGKYPKDDLNSLSAEAQELISFMLTYDNNDRPSAKECLEHKWIKDLAPNDKLNSKSNQQIFQNLKNFTAVKKLEEATFSYIVNFLVDKDEMNELKSTFLKLDANNDGTLTKQEIVDGYAAVFGPGSIAQVDLIFKNIDKDQSGLISYDGG